MPCLQSTSTFQKHSLVMANAASLSLLFLSLLVICCSGTLVGFSYCEGGDTAPSTSTGTISLLKQNNVSPSQIRIFVTDDRTLSTLTNSDLSVDFYLNKSLVEIFSSSKHSAISWLKTHIVNFLPQVDIKSIIASYGSESLSKNEASVFVCALESIHSVLSKLHMGREVKVSVAFPLSCLANLNPSHDNDLHRILSYIKEINSYVMIEDSIDGESMGNHFLQSVIKRTTLVASILPCKDVPIVLKIKIPAIPSSMEVAQFSERLSKYLEASTQITGRIVALYAEVSVQKELKREEEEIFPLSRKKILSKFHIRRTLGDTTVFPTNPTSATPIPIPTDTPTIITVPSTNPVTVSPTNPAAVPVPSTTPVPLPPTNPANSPVPVTNPVTVPGAQPVTSPVTSYPPPPAPVNTNVPVINPPPPPVNTNVPVINPPPPPVNTNVPVINPPPPPVNTNVPVIKPPPPTVNTNVPVINPPPPPVNTNVPVINPPPPPVNTNVPVINPPPPPVNTNVPVINPPPPPVNSNAPAITGQRWCVAKTGAAQTALQSALDYACGIGRADCSQIQQGGRCYNPNTLQNHASYAFNSYYQKNPAPTSCDFGGTATLVNTNPSSGSCIYPSSSSTPMPSSPTNTSSTPTPTASSSSGAGASGYGTPPAVLNSSSPLSGSGNTPGFGSESPPVGNTTTWSHSSGLRPFVGCMILVISLVSGELSVRL